MSLLKNILKKQEILLQLELLISNRSYCKLVYRDPENDFDIMLACTLFYVKLLKEMTSAERNSITGFFLGLNKVALEMDDEYVELSFNTVNPQNIQSRVIIKLIENDGKIKELRFSKLNKAILHEYILQFFRFTLGSISTVYRRILIATFLSLSKMDIQGEISEEDIESTANKTLLCLYHDAA